MLDLFSDVNKNGLACLQIILLKSQNIKTCIPIHPHNHPSGGKDSAVRGKNSQENT